jgi:acetyl esterase/lipase
MEVRIYEGAAPGSENWTWQEGANDNNSVRTMTVFNVVHPTLTVYAPDPGNKNGAGIIICPGGGFHFLAVDHEGSNAAFWLAKKGFTAFVLKYRLARVFTDNPFDATSDKETSKKWDNDALLSVIPLAIADGRQAIRHLRTNSDKYGVDAKRIGIMGFSAGGLVAAATASDYTSDTRPDFVASIYGDLQATFFGPVPIDAPPLFLACAQDDEFCFTPKTIAAYNRWYNENRSVEMHLFSKGGHGFGIGVDSTPTHNWLEQFHRWLGSEGLI